MTGETPLIYNPRSAGGKGAERAKSAESLLAARGIPVRLAATAGPGGARPLAASLAAEGHDRILVVGGDGTLSEAADGILSSGRRVPLGFLPGGTGNSFLIDFGLTTLEAAADRIALGKPRRIDAAVAEFDGTRRHFINVSGAGFVAKVADFANRRFKWMGPASYTWAVFPELIRLRSPLTRLVLDGRVIEEAFPLVSVANTIHTGGAMKMAPTAVPDDGLLDVVACRKVGRIGLLRLFPMIFDGSHVGHERILHARAKEIRIEPAEPSPLLFDGEVAGHTPVTIRVLPGALDLLV